VQAIGQMTPARRDATLAALVTEDRDAQDDVLDHFDRSLAELDVRVREQAKRQRLADSKTGYETSGRLPSDCEVLLDTGIPRPRYPCGRLCRHPGRQDHGRYRGDRAISRRARSAPPRAAALALYTSVSSCRRCWRRCNCWPPTPANRRLTP
jgi:hypothetical protein